MSTEQENLISLKNISVGFQRDGKNVDAVNDVSLDVTKGDIYGIIGYSGAGKSTLVRVMNLLQKPSSGTVTVDGLELQTLKPQELRNARKSIGMIFQHFNLMKTRTVLGNVEYPLLSKKLSKLEREQRALELLKLVGLEEYANSYPSQLSGGQKQRVAIARSLANDPKVLISDEATSALDPKTTISILELLKKLNEELGLTIVLITHEMQVIKGICHNVAVMEEGRVVERGRVAEVFTNPQQALTNDFVETSTNVKSAIERITADPNLSDLADNQQLIYLNFIGNSSKEGVISELTQKYQIDVNILFANIDQVDGQNVGYMIAILTGTKESTTQAISDLKHTGVKTRLLKTAEGVK